MRTWPAASCPDTPHVILWHFTPVNYGSPPVSLFPASKLSSYRGDQVPLPAFTGSPSLSSPADLPTFLNPPLSFPSLTPATRSCVAGGFPSTLLRPKLGNRWSYTYSPGRTLPVLPPPPAPFFRDGHRLSHQLKGQRFSREPTLSTSSNGGFNLLFPLPETTQDGSNHLRTPSYNANLPI